MKAIIIPREEFQKGFVKQHTRKGKKVASYFTKRQKKVATVRHTKKTRMDLSGSDAKAKIKALEAKKQNHSEHISIAESLKKKVEEHKSEGNTHLQIGKTKHDVNKLISDLKDHIQHHSNEKQSHHNHIEKIKDRHKTEAKHWEKKANKTGQYKKIVIVSKEKQETRMINIKNQEKAVDLIRKVLGGSSPFKLENDFGGLLGSLKLAHNGGEKLYESTKKVISDMHVDPLFMREANYLIYDLDKESHTESGMKNFKRMMTRMKKHPNKTLEEITHIYFNEDLKRIDRLHG